MYSKKLSIWILTISIIVLSGCNKMLDINPTNAVTRDQMFNENKDPYAIKSGLYNTLQGLVEQRFVLGELRGDLVAPGRGAKNNMDVYEFLDHYVTPQNKYLDWSGFYQLINQCNDALVTLPKTLIGNPLITQNDSVKYHHIVGEVLWLRAWAYFTLIRNWGDVPFFTNPVYNIDSVKATPPVDKNIILDQLERDLIWASKNVYYNWAWNNINRFWNHETVNICAVIGLLGEVLNYRDKFSEAWTQGVYLKLLTTQPVNSSIPSMVEDWHNSFNIDGGCLTGGQDWFNVEFRYAVETFNNSWFEEGLVLAFDAENAYGGSGIYKERHTLGYFTNNLPEQGGWYYVKPSKSIVDMFKSNRDIYRGEWASYIIDNNTTLQTQDTLIWKYVGMSVTKDNNGNVTSYSRREPFVTYGNINIIRTSDIYLEAAECANRLGYTSTALSILNQNKSRVGVAPANLQADATMEDIENAIIDERALELAFEGERWYDLVRIANRRQDPEFLINKILQNVPASNIETVRARLELQAKNGFLLPYSAKAIQSNSYLSNKNR
jgi:hypothetical protein